MASSVNIGGAWRQLSKIWGNVGGAWRQVTKAHCNVGGAWKQWFTGYEDMLLQTISNSPDIPYNILDPITLAVLGQKNLVFNTPSYKITGIADKIYSQNISHYSTNMDIITSERNVETLAELRTTKFRPWQSERGLTTSDCDENYLLVGGTTPNSAAGIALFERKTLALIYNSNAGYGSTTSNSSVLTGDNIKIIQQSTRSSPRGEVKITTAPRNSPNSPLDYTTYSIDVMLPNSYSSTSANSIASLNNRMYFSYRLGASEYWMVSLDSTSLAQLIINKVNEFRYFITLKGEN